MTMFWGKVCIIRGYLFSMQFSFLFFFFQKKGKRKKTCVNTYRFVEKFFFFFFFEKRKGNDFAIIYIYMLYMYLYKLYWHQGHHSGQIIYTGISIKKKCGRKIPKNVRATRPHRLGNSIEWSRIYIDWLIQNIVPLLSIWFEEEIPRNWKAFTTFSWGSLGRFRMWSILYYIPTYIHTYTTTRSMKHRVI